MTKTGESFSPEDSGHTTMADTTSSLIAGRRAISDNGGEDEKEDEEKNELWETFSKSFGEVQTLLDRNRILIQQVNENHRSKIADNLTKNVALIREINGNIAKVVSLYSNLSSDFSHIFHHRWKQQ